MVEKEFRKTADITYGFEGHCKELGIYSKCKALDSSAGKYLMCFTF